MNKFEKNKDATMRSIQIIERSNNPAPYRGLKRNEKSEITRKSLNVISMMIGSYIVNHGYAKIKKEVTEDGYLKISVSVAVIDNAMFNNEMKKAKGGAK